MSLLLAAAEAELTVKIRNRIAGGAAVWEVAVSEMPAWLGARVAEAEVSAVFQSEHAAVAVLTSGQTVVARTHN
jgi:phage head maturation protease